MLAYMSAILNLCIFRDGSSANINSYVLGELHAKYGAFVRPVTIISLSHLTISGSRHWIDTSYVKRLTIEMVRHGER